jgi:hypothetical protein
MVQLTTNAAKPFQGAFSPSPRSRLLWHVFIVMFALICAIRGQTAPPDALVPADQLAQTDEQVTGPVRTVEPVPAPIPIAAEDTVTIPAQPVVENPPVKPVVISESAPTPARASQQDSPDPFTTKNAIVPEAFWNLVMIALALDWLYCLYKGFQNQIVLYFDKKDVFFSLVGPLAMVGSYSVFDASHGFWRLTLLVGGMAAAFCSIRSSIHHNGNVGIGLVVGVFKVSFALLWIGLVFGQLGRGGSKTSQQRREQVVGFLVFVLLLMLMEKLINGPAVRAQREVRMFQPA